MRNMLTIAWKETKLYFSTPTAYIVGAMFLALTGVFFVDGVTLPFAEASIRNLVLRSSFLLLFLSPLLTMRLLAEEQKLGTLELLLTAPVRDWEVVIGKYIASFVILVATIALTSYYVVLLYAFGNPDTGPMLSAYLGLVLYGAAALAVGLMASSLSSNQIVSAVVGIALLLILSFVDQIGGVVTGAGPVRSADRDVDELPLRRLHQRRDRYQPRGLLHQPGCGVPVPDSALSRDAKVALNMRGNSRQGESTRDVLLSTVKSAGFWSAIVAIVGAISVLGGGTLYLTISELENFAVSVLLIGLALLLLALILSPRAAALFLVGRRGRYGSNVLIMTLAFFVIAILVNFLLFRNPTRVDTTATQVFTLAPQTINDPRGILIRRCGPTPSSPPPARPPPRPDSRPRTC